MSRTTTILNLYPRRPRYSFFISSVREDTSDVQTLRDEILRLWNLGNRPEFDVFLAKESWSTATPNLTVIRESLTESKFFVAWISKNYLKHGKRGWIWVEFAYAHLIQLTTNPTPKKVYYPFVYHVLYKTSRKDLEQTPWTAYADQETIMASDKNFLSIPEIASKLVACYDEQMAKRDGQT